MAEKKPRRSFPPPLWLLWLRDAGHATEYDRGRAATVASSGAFEGRTPELRSLLRVSEATYGKGVSKMCRQPDANPREFAARAAVARATAGPKTSSVGA